MSDNTVSANVQQAEITGVKEFQVSGGAVTFGDITQIGSQTVVQQKSEFFEPTLEQFKPPIFTSPQITPRLIEIVRQQNLLVLAGRIDIDKAALARHLAWCLGQTLQQESKSGERKISIKEWQRSSDPLRIEVELQEAKIPTILLLTHIQPQDVRYDLYRIKNVASTGQHYIIVSTDTPLASWKLPESAKTFWLELSVEGLYKSDDLVTVLIQKLEEAKESLAPALASASSGDDKIIGNLTVQSIAERLKTPDRIVRFVQLLCADKKLSQEAAVLNLIELAQDNEHTLRQWYYTLLNSREQILALGLSLFDGLFDDQVFAALEEVVGQAWQRRDASLGALDYCDLDNLRNFFNFVGTETGEMKIESRLPEQRQMLFRVVWDSHRRKILTALPVIVQLVQKSVADRSFDLKLYGTEERRNQLRFVMAEVISDIGLLSPRAVQETLLQLAADKDIDVQLVAAAAIARWRKYGHDEELFSTLDSWWNAALIRRGAENSEDSLDYIRATVALTVGYAALYESPQISREEQSGLSPQLYNWLKNFSDDTSFPVLDRFGYHTLPLVVMLHLVQLRQMLYEMTRSHNYLNHAVAKSLAFAYSVNPAVRQQVQETLDLWYDECVKNRSRRSSIFSIYISQKQARREDWLVTHRVEIQRYRKEIQRRRLLRTVAFAYGEIRYGEGDSQLKADEAFDRLRAILVEEEAPFVRQAVIFAVRLQWYIAFDKTEQNNQYLEQIEVSLQNIVSKFTNEECDNLIKLLSELYLEQRRSLKGGDKFLKLEGKHYPSWLIDSERPKTAIEESMYRWIKQAKHPQSVKIALGAIIDFTHKLEQKEEADRNATIDHVRHFIAEFENWDERQTNDISWSYQLLASIATLNKGHYQKVICCLLPEAVKQDRFSPSALRFVLDKWRSDKKNEDILTISDLLKRGLWISKTWNCLLILGGVSLIILSIVLLVTRIQNSQENIDQDPAQMNKLLHS